MIDDLKLIHQRDKGDVLGVVSSEWEQLGAQISWFQASHLDAVANVVYAGVDGPLQAALGLHAAQACRVPFEVIADFNIPPYVGGNTLFIACVLSENPERVVEVLDRVAETGAQIAVITASSELAGTANQKGYLSAHMVDVRNERFAALYVLKALVTLLEMAGVSLVTQTEVAEAAAFLKRETVTWLPTVPTKLNLAKQIAQECLGRSIVVYTSPKLSAAAYAWKKAFNGNSKQLAWCGVISEFDDSEFIGWNGQPEQKPYAVVELRSSFDTPRVQERFRATERLLSGIRPSPNVIDVKGSTILEQLLWSTILADFVSSYLALLNGYEPASLVVLDKMKRTMGE